MALVRWTNIVCGALLVIAAFLFLAFLLGSIADYSQEPEDVWLSAIWIGLLGLFAALCFANARHPAGFVRFGWRTIANSVAVVAMAVLLIFGSDDPALLPLIALCSVGPLAALVGTWLRRPVEQP